MSPYQNSRSRFAETVNSAIPFRDYEHNKKAPCDCAECFTDRVMGRARWPMDLGFALIFFVHAVCFLSFAPHVNTNWSMCLVAAGGGFMFMAGWAFQDFRTSRKNIKKGLGK